MELRNVAQVIADAVNATCNGANEVPELANVQIRAVTESASSVLHTFLDFAPTHIATVS